jgi:hypothetical protein
MDSQNYNKLFNNTKKVTKEPDEQFSNAESQGSLR